MILEGSVSLIGSLTFSDGRFILELERLLLKSKPTESDFGSSLSESRIPYFQP